MPVLQTEYSRVYGMAGGRFAWFFERFNWRTVKFDDAGIALPVDAADYTNTLSQRMYGPFVGCGHEIYVANSSRSACDLTGASCWTSPSSGPSTSSATRSIQSKWGREEFRLVPNANAAVNLWWYPIEGVQIRVGYQAMTYFNTLYMLEPVGFNYGNIDPAYQTKYFRLLHGFNVGIGFFF